MTEGPVPFCESVEALALRTKMEGRRLGDGSRDGEVNLEELRRSSGLSEDASEDSKPMREDSEDAHDERRRE